MAKFNNTISDRTVNKDGYPAYKMNDKEKLVSMVLTSFFNEEKFYGDNSKELTETLKTVIKKDAKFVSNLAVFARKKFNMRTVSHVLTAFLAHEPNGKQYVRETVKNVVVRGDDVTEIMAFYLNTFGKPVPNSLKKGIGDAMKRFGEYTLAKYKGDGKSVKMRDLLCLCRPKPMSKEQEAMWKRCLEDKLETPYTWETELSANGNNKATWEKLISSKKVGYMALLRNLRNILNAKPDNVDDVLKYLADPVAVSKSRQLPFRFLSAYNSVQDIASSKVFDTLEEAVKASVNNVPRIPGKTVIAIDVSGSMSSPISRKSDIRCCDIAMMLGVIANSICDDAIVFTFDTELRKKAFPKNCNILYTAKHEAHAGGGTDMNLPFAAMLKMHIDADRVIIISDQMCNTSYGWSRPVQAVADEYRRLTNNDIWVHAVDLMGYGTQQFKGKKTNIIAGWSEKLFDFIGFAEMGEGGIVKLIENM